MTPTDRKYSRDCLWVMMQGQEAVMGITDHAQHALGDILFVELPAPGKTLAVGDAAAYEALTAKD